MARTRPSWSYVGTKLAYAGPGLDPCCLMLAQVGAKVAHVGPDRGHVGLMLVNAGLPKASGREPPVASGPRLSCNLQGLGHIGPMLGDLGALLRSSSALERRRSGQDGPRPVASLLM